MQDTAARQSLDVRPPLPHGMLGLQDGASNISHDDQHPSQSQRPSGRDSEEPRPRNLPTILTRVDLLVPQNDISPRLADVHRQKARQSRGVPVPHPRKRKPRNHLDILRPNPFLVASRGQREAVFKAAERLRARSFCGLPAELRLIIYNFVLTSQSPITPRLAGAQKAGSKEAPVDVAASLAQAKVSSLALLQTCRLANNEARPVYYTSNTFRFTSAKDLVDFLHGIGPDLREKLRKLHIEGLVIDKPFFSAERLEKFRNEGMSRRVRRSLAKMRWPILDDNANLGGYMLRQCRRLHRIHLSMDRKEESHYIRWLTMITGYSNATIEFVDDGRWLAKPSASGASADEWHKILNMALADPASRRALFPELKRGRRRCIDVDLDMDRLMKEAWSRMELMV